MIRLLMKTYLFDGIFNGADLLTILIAALVFYLFFIKPVLEEWKEEEF